MKTVMFRIRIEPQFKQLLQNAVKKGIANSMSELIREAVKKYLEECDS